MKLARLRSLWARKRHWNTCHWRIALRIYGETRSRHGQLARHQKAYLQWYSTAKMQSVISAISP